jgi:catechol 2,3-dioxygenase-like lactoylglutathione lyase family enzyme
MSAPTVPSADGQAVGLDHVAIQVTDLDRAIYLLGKHFGFVEDVTRHKVLDDGELSVTILRSPQLTVELVAQRSIHRPLSDGQIAPHLAFQVASIATFQAALAADGVSTDSPEPQLVRSAWNQWVVAETCAGIRIQLISPQL